MNIEFEAIIASAKANIIDGFVTISAQLKLSDLGSDNQDAIAEVCNTDMPVEVHIDAQDKGQLDLNCTIDTFRGNLAEGSAVVNIKIPRKEITVAAEALLSMVSMLRLKVMFNIVNRQMKFTDIVPDALRSRVDSVTMTHKGRRVEVKHFNTAPQEDEE